MKAFSSHVTNIWRDLCFKKMQLCCFFRRQLLWCYLYISFRLHAWIFVFCRKLGFGTHIQWKLFSFSCSHFMRLKGEFAIFWWLKNIPTQNRAVGKCRRCQKGSKYPWGTFVEKSRLSGQSIWYDHVFWVKKNCRNFSERIKICFKLSTIWKFSRLFDTIYTAWGGP